MASSDSTQLSSRAKDETGNVYGRLTVLAYAGKTKSGDSKWSCRCECGNITTVPRGSLRKGYGGTKSCGCGRRSQGGGYSTTEYTTWKEMKRRCYNRRNSQYHLYGGRGIVICDRWRTSFVNFLADMGPKPFPEATIDRYPDNNGNYEPGNCRWATKLEQGQNTRKARVISYDGETMTLRSWARKLGITHRTLSVRIERGWPLEKALTTGSTATSNMLTHNGETMCVSDWARKTGIKEVTLRWRVSKGWTEDRIFAAVNRH